MDSLYYQTKKSVQAIVSYSDKDRDISNQEVRDDIVEYLSSELNMEDGLLSLDADEVDEILKKAIEQGIEHKVKPELHFINYRETIKVSRWYRVINELPEGVMNDLRFQVGPYSYKESEDEQYNKDSEVWSNVPLNSYEVKERVVEWLMNECKPGKMDGLDSLDMNTVGEVLHRAIFFGCFVPAE